MRGVERVLKQETERERGGGRATDRQRDRQRGAEFS